MNKNYLLKVLKLNGDSILTLYGESDIGVTTDFKTPYIKTYKKYKGKIPKNNVLLWSWTDNEYRIIDSNKVKKVIPLANILKNGE